MNVSVQNLKSILSDVAKTVIGNKATTAKALVGTWKYNRPVCQFESESVVAKTGSKAITSQVENKLEPIYKKFGMDDCSYTFHVDSTYTQMVKGKKTSGTYIFDPENKTVTMRTKLGMSVKAHVIVTGPTMTLLFNADKLMSTLKTLTNLTSRLSSAASTVNSLVNNYDGMLLGFELIKQ